MRYAQRGTMGFSRRRARVASADDAWAIGASSAEKNGARRKERLGREGEKVECKERVGKDGVS